MHTVKHKHYRLHFNADLSGDAILSFRGQDVMIPGELLEALVHEYLLMHEGDGLAFDEDAHTLQVEIWRQ